MYSLDKYSARIEHKTMGRQSLFDIVVIVLVIPFVPMYIV